MHPSRIIIQTRPRPGTGDPPSHDFTSYDAAFASPNAARKLFCKAGKATPFKGNAGLLSLLGGCAGGAIAADVATLTVHAVLREGGGFPLRWVAGAAPPRLSCVKVEKGQAWLTLEPPAAAVTLDEPAGLSTLPKDAYGRLLAPNLNTSPNFFRESALKFPGVDAVLLLDDATLLFRFLPPPASRDPLVGLLPPSMGGAAPSPAPPLASAEGLTLVLQSLPAGASRAVALLFVAHDLSGLGPPGGPPAGGLHEGLIVGVGSQGPSKAPRLSLDGARPGVLPGSEAALDAAMLAAGGDATAAALAAAQAAVTRAFGAAGGPESLTAPSMFVGFIGLGLSAPSLRALEMEEELYSKS